MARFSREQSNQGIPSLSSCAFLILGLLAVFAFLFGSYMNLMRPLGTVGQETSGTVVTVSGTGSDRTVSYRFDIRKENGRFDHRKDSETVWAYETHNVHVGGRVPVVYDPQWPSRHRLGSQQESWGGWGISSLLKQAGYAAVMAIVGLIWMAITGRSSNKSSR